MTVLSIGWCLRYETFGSADWRYFRRLTRSTSRSLAAQRIVSHMEQPPQDPPEGALSDKTGYVARIQAGLGGSQRTWSRWALIARYRLWGCHLIVRMVAVTQHRVDVLRVAELLEEGDQIQQLGIRHVIEPGRHWNLRKASIVVLINFSRKEYSLGCSF